MTTETCSNGDGRIAQLRSIVQFGNLASCKARRYQLPENGKENSDSSSRRGLLRRLWLRCLGHFPTWCASWTLVRVQER